MAGLSLKHVYKTYNNEIKLKSGQESPKPAVSDFNMDIEDKEFIVFVGPSGCGKSTTLRMIAGLEEITSGEIYIDNRLVNNIEPKDRDIAMVFQSYALYPHMSVYDNMAFALRLRKIPDVKRDKKGNPILNKNNKEIPIMRRYTKDEIDEKVRNAAAILDITDYLKRKPKALSGGQRQRVALGRAIVRNPKVFLLDEPLSNLDAKLRSQMRTEITKLHEKLQTTFIYVTHDQVEAMTMGTRIVVMESGYVKQIDTPQNLYKYPENKFVAGFIGTPQMNFFDGVITKNGDKVTFKFDCDAEIILDYEKANKILTEYTDGKHRVTFGIRPDDIRLYDGSMDVTEWEAEDVVVGVVENLGGETLIYADLDIRNKDNEKDGGSIVLKTNNEFKGRRGDIVKIAINKNNIHVFDKETEVSIKTRIPE